MRLVLGLLLALASLSATAEPRKFCIEELAGVCLRHQWREPTPKEIEDELKLTPAKHRQIQIALRALDHYEGLITGWLDPATRKAIRAWQAARRYKPANGYLVKAQERELLTIAANARKPSLKVTFPGRGQRWLHGLTKTIRWRARNIPGRVAVMITYPGRSIHLAMVKARDGRYSFKVPDDWPVRSDYRAVIEATRVLRVGTIRSASAPFSVMGGGGKVASSAGNTSTPRPDAIRSVARSKSPLRPGDGSRRRRVGATVPGTGATAATSGHDRDKKPGADSFTGTTASMRLHFSAGEHGKKGFEWLRFQVRHGVLTSISYEFFGAKKSYRMRYAGACRKADLPRTWFAGQPVVRTGECFKLRLDDKVAIRVLPVLKSRAVPAKDAQPHHDYAYVLLVQVVGRDGVHTELAWTRTVAANCTPTCAPDGRTALAVLHKVMAPIRAAAPKGAENPRNMPVAAVVASAVSNFVMQRDFDLPGHDLLGIRNISLAACAYACLRRSDCAAYTFNERNRACFMKSGYGESRAHPGAVSGMRRDFRKPDAGAARPAHEGMTDFTAREGTTSRALIRWLRTETRFAGAVSLIPPEGSLATGRYYVHEGIDRNRLISEMRRRMQIATANAAEYMRRYRTPFRNVDDVVVLASIIAAHSSDPATQRLISSVFHNRMARGMRLQSDATVAYAVTRGRAPLSRAVTEADRRTASPFNTFLKNGLPPRPIGNPGVNAIKAALMPADTSYFFFVGNDKTGVLFGSSIEHHNQNVKALKSKGEVETRTVFK